MKLLFMIGLVIGIFNLYYSLYCFVRYMRTKENIYKRTGALCLLISIPILLLVFKDLLPIPSYIIWFVIVISAFAAISIYNKKIRLQPSYEVSIKGKNYLILNIIIILTLLFLSIFVFAGITMKSQYDLLINKGRVISAVVVDNAKLGSYNIIYYQFNDNGVLVRDNKSFESSRRTIIQGKNVKEFKKGDRIEVLFYNGKSMIKGWYEQHSKSVIFVIVGLLILLVWAIRRRFVLVEKT